jgi:hypothetical protein
VTRIDAAAIARWRNRTLLSFMAIAVSIVVASQ